MPCDDLGRPFQLFSHLLILFGLAPPVSLARRGRIPKKMPKRKIARHPQGQIAAAREQCERAVFRGETGVTEYPLKRRWARCSGLRGRWGRCSGLHLWKSDSKKWDKSSTTLFSSQFANNRPRRCFLRSSQIYQTIPAQTIPAAQSLRRGRMIGYVLFRNQNFSPVEKLSPKKIAKPWIKHPG